MEVVRKLVGDTSGGANGDADADKQQEKVAKESGDSKTHAQETEHTAVANNEEESEVAAEVADSAEKLDAGVEA